TKVETGSTIASELYSTARAAIDFLGPATISVYPLRRLIHQQSHLRMRGFEARLDSILGERLGGARTDRTDPSASQSGERLLFETEVGGDTYEVLDLDGGGEQRRIEFAPSQAARRFAQRVEVFRKRVLIDTNGGHFRAARAQAL